MNENNIPHNNQLAAETAEEAETADEDEAEEENYNEYDRDDEDDKYKLGEDDAICVYHEFGSKYVVDYDMAYGMPDAVREWLNANGYDTEDILG